MEPNILIFGHFKKSDIKNLDKLGTFINIIKHKHS